MSGLSLALLLVALAPGGCGRVGFDPLGSHSPAGTNPDASSGSDGAGDGGSTGAGGGGVSGGDGGSISAGGASGEGGTSASGGASGLGGVSSTSGSGGMSGADAGPKIRDAGPDVPVLPPCNVTAVADYCASVPALPTVPVIDGNPDCSLPLAPMPELGWTGGATAIDAHAEYGFAWRPDGLYLYVRVRDPSLVPADSTREVWQGDALEIYVDGDGAYAAPPAYDDPGTRQLVAGAPASATSTSAVGKVYASGHPTVEGPWTSTRFRSFGRSDGYVVEAFIGAADLGLASLSLASGGKVGVDLSVDVSYPTDQGADAAGFGNRVGQYFLRLGSVNGGNVLPPFDVRAFCTPSLVP